MPVRFEAFDVKLPAFRAALRAAAAASAAAASRTGPFFASFEDRSNSRSSASNSASSSSSRALFCLCALFGADGARPRVSSTPCPNDAGERGRAPSAAGRAAEFDGAAAEAARFASASSATRCCLAPRLRNGRGAADDVSGVFAAIVALVESSRGAKEGDAGVAARGSEADASDASSSASKDACGAPGTGTSSRSNPFSFVCGSVTRDVSSFSSFSRRTEAAATSASMASPSYAVAPSTSSAPSRALAQLTETRIAFRSPSSVADASGAGGASKYSGPRGIVLFFLPDWYSPGSEGPPFCSSCSDDLRVGEGEGQTA